MNQIINNILQQCGGIQGFANIVNQTEQNLRGQGISAEGQVQDFLNSGKANQQQLQLAMKIANMFCGRN